MKRAMSLASLLVAAAVSAWANTSLTVNVNDQTGAGIPSAVIYAIHFQQNGFDAANSQVVTANGSGTATLSLADGNWYDVFASSQNYFPALSQQYNDPNHPGLSANGGTASAITIALSSGAQVNVGEIDIRVTNATSTLISGDVRYSNGSFTVAYGFGSFNKATNSGKVQIFNVPPASGQTYNVEAFDPFSNGNNAIIPNYGSAVTAGNTTVTPIIDMTATAAPPPAAVAQVQQGGPVGNENFDGVVTDTNGINTIPFVGLTFNYKKFDNYGCQQQSGGCDQTLYNNADPNGRFQLFGLLPETTYYASAQGGCSFNQNTNTTQCYLGFNSPGVSNGQNGTKIDTTTAPGANDILIHSTMTLTTAKIKLKAATGGSGKLDVYIKASPSGAFIPWSGVSLWPDGSPWVTCATSLSGNNNCSSLPADCASNPRLSNGGFTAFNGQATTGYVTISNVLSGNYILTAWTGFSQGGNGTMYNSTSTSSGGGNNSFSQCGSSNYRLFIDTGATPDVKVFDSYGNLVSQTSSVTVTVPLTAAGLSGLVTGSLNFTGTSGTTVDLSANPITITMQPQCSGGGPCTGGNFLVLNSKTQALSSTYQVQVATGQVYWFNISSSYWGQVRTHGGGNNQIDLTSTGTVTMGLAFAPAGRWVGKVYKPGNTIFTPSQNSWADVNAVGQNSWGWSNINPDGSFVMGGLLPGNYGARFSQNQTGAQPYVQPDPLPSFNIVANQDSYQDIALSNGVNVRVVFDTTTVPAVPNFNCDAKVGEGECPPEGLMVHPIAAGTPPSNDLLRTLMGVSGEGGEKNQFFLFQSTGEHGGEGCFGPITITGFCIKAMPDQTPFDLYLIKGGRFDSAGLANPPARPYFVLYTSSKNVLIDSSKATTQIFEPGSFGSPGSSVTVQALNIALSSSLRGTPQGTLRGNVTAQNFITQQEFIALGGSFENFVKYIPLAGLYDSNGTLKAGGATVPTPTCLQNTVTINGLLMTIEQRMNQLIAGGTAADYSNFVSLVNTTCMAPPWQFEIRGLTPGQTYNLVLQSPNYPPYKTNVTLSSVDGDTTTISVDLDKTVGTGATISGVVTDTNSVVIANAAVTIKSPGYPPQTVNTDTSGKYSISGLPSGSFRVKVVAATYALRAARVDVISATTYTQNFSLPLGPGSITGYVRDIKPPRLPLTAKILAYSDTLNQTAGTELALYETATSSVGYFNIQGLETGSSYKLFVKASGKRVIMISTTATSGAISLSDTAMADKPLDVEAFGHPTSPNYEFTIFNPKDFSGGRAWIGNSPFVKTNSTDVSGSFQQRAQGDGTVQLILDYPLTSLGSTSHILHIEATSKNPTPANLAGNPDVTKDIAFSATTPGSVIEHMDEALIGDDDTNAQGIPNNAAVLDNSGQNGSQMSLPAGAIIPSSTGAIPTVNFTASDTSDPTVSTMVALVPGGSSAFVSGIYQATLSSANYTGSSGVDITLQYNQNGSSFNDLAIYHLNSVTGQWEAVPGVQTIDPLKGTITIKRVKSFSSVQGLKRSHAMMALSDGHSFRPNGLLADDSGSFAILKPSVAGGTFSGTTVKIFNFPNPFNLQTKTLTLANGGATPNITTSGTVIKVELPAGMNGDGVIRIYTLAGELVRELDMGNLTGGAYYYTSWDGKNKSGSNVANGVYYGILSVPGAKTKDTTFKMAVIK